MRVFLIRSVLRSTMAVICLGLGLSLSATGASAAESPTSCEATLNANLDLSITMSGVDLSRVAFDAVGAQYQFLGRFDGTNDGSPLTVVIGPDNPAGFIADNVTVEIRGRTIGTDGSKSARFSCGSVRRIPGLDESPGSPAFCFLRPDADPTREGLLINDESSNRQSYNRVVFEQFVNDKWSVVRTEFVGGIGERFFLGGLESIEGLFRLDDYAPATRVRGQFKRLADGTTVEATNATVCTPLPTTPPTVTAPTCRTSPSFYLGADGSRRILGVKVSNGAVQTNDLIWDDTPRLTLRYVSPDGTVVRESVTAKWKDVPVGTYTVQIRSETFDYPLMRLSKVASDWVTCGTETVT